MIELSELAHAQDGWVRLKYPGPRRVGFRFKGVKHGGQVDSTPGGCKPGMKKHWDIEKSLYS